MKLIRDVPSEGLQAQCDPDLLRIVAVNLFGNGVKYGRTGGALRVGAARTETGVLVTSWNEGPGFPESQRGRLFRRFSRLDSPELKSRKGTGVGLYTSWRIVRLHHGTMDASSEEGKWAEFRFTIPQPLPAEPVPAE